MTDQGIIQRAFGLAGSGRFRDVQQLEKALSREGFLQVSEHLRGRSLRIQLRTLMARQPEEDAPAAR